MSYRRNVNGWVYFITCPIVPEFPIKIGFATDVRKRMYGIQTSLPFEIKLLGAVPGTIETEREICRRFAKLHVRGEWFWQEPSLLDYITSLPPYAEEAELPEAIELPSAPHLSHQERVKLGLA